MLPPLCKEELTNLILVKESGCFKPSENQKLIKTLESNRICHNGARRSTEVLPIRATNAANPLILLPQVNFPLAYATRAKQLWLCVVL